MKSRIALVLAAMFGAAGCNNNSTPDTDVVVNDATPADAAGGATVPTGNFGATEGSNFAPVTLPACAEAGGEVEFYGADYGSAKLTLMILAAGWCVPCQNEARQIEQEITSAYRNRGLRVIVVIGQNPDFSTPTVEFCRTWRDRYQLTSTMAIDPEGLTQVYFERAAYPANLLVSNTGQLVYRKYGTSAGLADLKAAIDTFLAP